MRLALTVLAFALIAAPAQARRPCGPADAPTLASGALTRVYVAGKRLAFCTRGHRPVVTRQKVWARFLVAGRWVAETGNGYFAIYDARDGTAPAPEQFGGDVRLTRRGGVVGQTDDGKIMRSPGCGDPVLGTGADAGSLRLDGPSARWTAAGVPQAARACPTGAIAHAVCDLRPGETVTALSRWGAMVERAVDDITTITALCTPDGRRRIAQSQDVEDFGSEVDPVAQSGPWFAWTHQLCWKECTVYGTFAENAQTGERREMDTYGFYVAHLLVSPAGTMVAAFAGCGSYERPALDCIVAQSAERVVFLDEGYDLDLLRVDAERAYWTSGGVPQSAPLP